MDTFLAERFNTEQDSDLEVDLDGADLWNGDEPPAQRARLQRSFFLHKVVVRQSGLLGEMLLIQEQGPGAAAPSAAARGGRARLHVSVDAEDLDAGELTLRLLYARTIPAETQQRYPEPAERALLLLRMHRLADMWQLPPACLAVTTAALCALRGSDLNGAAVAAALGGILPDHLRVAPSLAPLTRAVQFWLVERYGDVRAVMHSDELRAEFRALSAAAMELWVRDDNLQVHLENDVLLAASVWLFGKQLSPAERDAIMRGVRVRHLSSSYVHAVLPRSELFRGCSDAHHLPAVMIYREAGLLAVSASGFPGPRGWVERRRERIVAEPATVFDLDLGVSEIQALTAQQCQYSATAYRCGHFLRLRLQLVEDAQPPSPSDRWHLCAAVERDLDALQRLFYAPDAAAAPLPELRAFSNEPFSLEAGLEVPEAAGGAATIAPSRAHTGVRLSWRSATAATAQGALQPWMRQGRLRLRATVRLVR